MGRDFTGGKGRDELCGANPFQAPLDAFKTLWTEKVLTRLPQPPQPVQKAAADLLSKVDRRRRSVEGDAPVAEKRLDLTGLNPSLYVVGLETVERILPRYLSKAGIACERMQHAGLPVEAVRRV